MAITKKILVVDECESDRSLIKGIFEQRFEVIEAANGLEALVLLSEEQENVAVLIMEVSMSEISGMETLQLMKDAHLTDGIPVVLMTTEALENDVMSGIEFGMSDFIVKPFNRSAVYSRILIVLGEQEDEEDGLEFFTNSIEIEMPEQTSALNPDQQVKEAVGDPRVNLKEVDTFERHVFSLIQGTFRIRGFENSFHLRRVKMCTKVLLQELSADPTNTYYFPDGLIEIIARASVYHDIGKLALPDEVVKDKGEVWVNHRRLYQSHTILGSEILRMNNNPKLEAFIKLVSNIALYHHERWDGTGFPHGLKGLEIPMAAQIVGVVQRYDHMIMDSHKRVVGTFEDVIHRIFMDAGAHNPILIAALPKCKERFMEIAACNGMILQ